MAEDSEGCSHFFEFEFGGSFLNECLYIGGISFASVLRFNKKFKEKFIARIALLFDVVETFFDEGLQINDFADYAGMEAEELIGKHVEDGGGLHDHSAESEDSGLNGGDVLFAEEDGKHTEDTIMDDHLAVLDSFGHGPTRDGFEGPVQEEQDILLFEEVFVVDAVGFEFEVVSDSLPQEIDHIQHCIAF